MAVVTMRHMRFIGLLRDKEAVLNRLLRLGVVDITGGTDGIGGEADSPAEEEPEEVLSERAQEYERRRLLLATAMRELEKFDTRRKSLFAGRRRITESELATAVAEQEDTVRKVREITDAREKMHACRSEIDRLDDIRKGLRPWSLYPNDLSAGDTKWTRTVFLSVADAAVQETLQARIAEEGIAAGCLTLRTGRDGACFALTYHTAEETRVQALLQSADVVRQDLAQYTGTPGQCLTALAQEIRAQQETLDRLQAQLEAGAVLLPQIEVLYDYYGMEIEKERAAGRMQDTRATFLFEGWVPQKAEAAVRGQLAEDFICHVELRDARKDEVPPTLLQNGPLGGSFEPVESMYSTLAYGALDPSTISAFFFALFFGFMLSDAGYGILLTVACSLILLLAKPSGSLRRYITLFLFCGVSTVVWGAVFGSWFGNLLPTVTFGRFALKPLWFDPSDSANTEHFLAFTLLLGVVHVFVALGIKAANLIARGKWLDALFDVVFWYVFYIGEILFLLPYIPYYGTKPLAVRLHPYGIYILAVGFVLILVTKGRASKNPFVRMFGGITCLYSLVDMLSDALSYTRLMAMGLATSVIINVFNQIAATAGGLAAGAITLRFVFFVLIFLAANLFNFAISALSSYVNACRLTYIEFFGKFYEGDGREFAPLCQNTEYVILE